MVTQISVEQALNHKDSLFIDTRTPAEFQEDHLPNALNFPLLSNEERAVIGTLYKQVSKEEAIEKGIGFFSAKMSEYIKSISAYKKRELIIYCWRGGMRSRTISALLESLGFTVLQLNGGYKAYRQYIQEKMQKYILKPTLVVLHGLTCTGKTELLQEFHNSVDLEHFAQHRSSLYGAIGLTPNSQKKFENLLFHRVEELQHLVIEGESRRIGDVLIPEFVWKSMNKGIHIEIKRSPKVRIAAAIREYLDTPEKVEAGKKITATLNRLISSKHKQEIIDNLNNQNYADAMKILFEQYYDPLYSHSLKSITYDFQINNDNPKLAAQELVQKITPFLRQRAAQELLEVPSLSALSRS